MLASNRKRPEMQPDTLRHTVPHNPADSDVSGAEVEKGSGRHTALVRCDPVT